MQKEEDEGKEREREICATGELSTAFGADAEKGEMTSADFSRAEADVVLTRGCVSSILLVILSARGTCVA